jgi:hypothetical protein
MSPGVTKILPPDVNVSMSPGVTEISPVVNVSLSPVVTKILSQGVNAKPLVSFSKVRISLVQLGVCLNYN